MFVVFHGFDPGYAVGAVVGGEGAVGWRAGEEVEVAGGEGVGVGVVFGVEVGAEWS